MTEEMKEWCKGIEKQLSAIKQDICRLDTKEGGSEYTPGKIIELDLTLPEGDFEGLHFNKTEVHGVFELKDDGWYHSRDILFLSARNASDDNITDALTTYLCSYNYEDGVKSIKEQIAHSLGCFHGDIEISLPKESEGVKKYNGVNSPYWQEAKLFGSTGFFSAVYFNGSASGNNAGSLCGCAPMFRIKP
jgi:hypothetical protein